jgi:hypothetical protein
MFVATDKTPFLIYIINHKKNYMEKTKFETKLQSVNEGELEAMQVEILEEIQICLAQVVLYSSSVTCFLFHVKNSGNEDQLKAVIRDIRNYTELFDTLQYQAKCTRKQIDYIKHCKNLI